MRAEPLKMIYFLVSLFLPSHLYYSPKIVLSLERQTDRQCTLSSDCLAQLLKCKVNEYLVSDRHVTEFPGIVSKYRTNTLVRVKMVHALSACTLYEVVNLTSELVNFVMKNR